MPVPCQIRTPRGTSRSFAAVSASLGIALLIASVLLAPPAIAAGTSALCEGYTAGCKIRANSDAVGNNTVVEAHVDGHPGVAVTLRFYVVKVDGNGQIAGLLPGGQPVSGATLPTNAAGTTGRFSATLNPQPPAGTHTGGWGFIGLADDDTLDLTRRIGTLVEYSGRTLRLLGDEYATQKPIHEALELHVVGHVKDGNYWVEYCSTPGPSCDDGDWMAVPGQGYGDPQRLQSSPGDPASLRYTVPDTLTPGETYRFRINSHSNGRPGQPSSYATYTEWDVIPSESPTREDRKKNLNPNEHRFDPSLVSGPSPSPSPSPTEKPDKPKKQKPKKSKPTGTPQESPTADPTDAPAPPQSAAPPPSGTSLPPPSAPPGPPPSAGPAPGAPPPVPAPTPQPSATPTAPAGAVWGNEAVPTGNLQATSAPMASSTSSLLAMLGLGLLTAPLVWWLLARRRSADAAREPLRTC